MMCTAYIVVVAARMGVFSRHILYLPLTAIREPVAHRCHIGSSSLCTEVCGTTPAPSHLQFSITIVAEIAGIWIPLVTIWYLHVSTHVLGIGPWNPNPSEHEVVLLTTMYEMSDLGSHNIHNPYMTPIYTVVITVMFHIYIIYILRPRLHLLRW